MIENGNNIAYPDLAQNHIFFNGLSNESINKNEEDNKINSITYPQDEAEENRLYELAIKKSEEEAKLLKEREEEEEMQLIMALKESEKLMYENNLKMYNFELNNNNSLNNQIINNNSINDNNNNNNNNYSSEINIKNSEEKEEFDEEYGICPITQEYMKNPVLSPSGNYYEKSAITEWIEKNKTDPMTREELTVDMLVEDEEYKNAIIKYREKFNK